jgi:DNA invertase Pin-like site-specific DNA recombinase
MVKHGGLPNLGNGGGVAAQPRVVGGIRLSRYTDASTSFEVQEEMIETANARIGGKIVGWARDKDVSALKTTPWEREELAYWLDRPDEWDALIWQRMDRAVRSMADMADLGRYAKRHGKRLVFASGPGGALLELDFSSPMSELIMLILAFAAQLEGQTIMERTQGAAAHLQSLGRWPGGPVPYGFLPARKTFSDGNEGWWLAEHKHTADVRRAMIARAISGLSYESITTWLNDSGAVTPANHRAQLAGREVDPNGRWMTTTVRTMLLSPIVRGHLVTREGVTIRAADGSPVLQGAALVDDDTWYRLQDALSRRAVEALTAPRRKDAHELLGVLVCGVCERNFHARVRSKSSRGQTREQYTCNSRLHDPGVPYPAVPRRETLDFVSEEFIRRFGFFRRTQMVRVAGVDNRAEIAELEEVVQEVSARLLRLRGVAADAVQGQLEGVAARLETLREVPFIPAREELVELDTTWGDAWKAAEDDWSARRQMLLDLHVRVLVGPPTGWRRPVGERLRLEIFRPDPEADDMAEAFRQATE